MLNHLKPHSCTKCHKLGSIQVRQEWSSCDCVWMWPAVSSIYSRYNTPGGRGGGWPWDLSPQVSLANLTYHSDTVLTTLPKAKTHPAAKTMWQQSLATSQWKMLMHRSEMWMCAPRSCLVVMRCGVPLHCTVLYCEVSHCTQNCIPILKLFNNNSYNTP